MVNHRKKNQGKNTNFSTARSLKYETAADTSPQVPTVTRLLTFLLTVVWRTPRAEQVSTW